MSRGGRFGLGDVILFVIILAAAAGARAWYLSNCAHAGTTEGAFQVQDPFNKLGEGERTFHTAPLYPWFLSLVSRVSAEPGDVNRLVRCIQAALGALSAGLYYLFARRSFDSRAAGMIAGLLCALHPFWIINTAEVNDGVLATFLLAGCLFLGGFGNRSGGFLPSWLYGVCLAGLALVRAALLPFAWIALLWFLLRCRTLPRGWLYGFLAFLGFVTGLAPLAIRNFRDFHEILPVVDSTYFHLWQGNHPQATGGPWTGSPGELPGQTKEQLARAVWDEVRNHPSDTLQRRLRAGLFFLFGEDWLNHQLMWRAPTADQPDVSVPEWVRRSHASILYGTVLGMLVLVLLGWRWSYSWGRQAMPLSLALIWIPLPYVLSHAEALAGPRLPLDGVLFCYAAFALACLLPGTNLSFCCRRRRGEGEG